MRTLSPKERVVDSQSETAVSIPAIAKPAKTNMLTAAVAAGVFSVLSANQGDSQTPQSEKNEKQRPAPVVSTYTGLEDLIERTNDEKWKIRQKATDDLIAAVRAHPELKKLLFVSAEGNVRPLETNQRTSRLVKNHMSDILPKEFPVQFPNYPVAPWIDGLAYRPPTNQKSIRLPIYPDAEISNYSITSPYLARAKLAGAKEDSSPNWTNYGVATEILFAEIRDLYGRNAFASAVDREAVLTWVKKNPPTEPREEWLRKKADFLVDRFQEEKGRRQKEMDAIAEEFIDGTENYRKNNRLPTLRPEKEKPMPGPEL